MTIGMITIIIIFLFLIYFYQTKNILLGLRDDDAFFHLSCGQEIKENKGIFKYHKKFYPGKNVLYTYPPFLHILLSLIVDRIPVKLTQFLPIFMSFLLSILIFLTCLTFGYPVYSSLLASLIFLLLPTTLRETECITPRQLGIAFFFLSFSSAALALELNSIIFYVFSIFFLGMLLLSHRMGTQLAIICFMFNIIYVLFNHDVIVIILGFTWLIGGFLFAMFFSKGHYKNVLKDHGKLIKLYFKKGPRYGEKCRLGNPFKLFLLNPSLILLSILIFYQFDNFQFSILWITTIGIMFTSIFWIWGYGEHHVNFIGPFVLLLLLELGFLNFPIQLFLCVFLATVMSALYIKKYYGTKLIPKETFQAYKYLNNEKTVELVIVLPKVASPAFVYNVNKKIFSCPHDSGAVDFNWSKVQSKLNNTDYMAKMILKNKVDTILSNKEFNITPIIQKINYSKKYENDLWEIYSTK